jgi:type IV pilus assembly protein PilM
MGWLPGKKQSVAKTGGRPPVAVELAPEGVLAAALSKKGAEATYAFAALPAGALAPGIGEVNLKAPDAVANALRKALDEVSPRTHSVTLILPDTAVRVFVLDFDSLPAKAAEVLPVLRFRLRKMLPFDLEQAGLSYQVLSQEKSEYRVLVVAIPGPVLAEYEAAVREAGYEPGAVLPSSLAALAGLEKDEPVLAACISGASLTTTITHGDDLLLYRTADLPEDPVQCRAEVQRDIAVAAAYFEDKMAAHPDKLLLAGVGSAQNFAQWLDDATLHVAEMAGHPTTGMTTTTGSMSFAAVNGALAGAR